MIYLDKFLHFISADGHHYKVPSSTIPGSPPGLTVEGRPFAADPARKPYVSRPLPLAYSLYDPTTLAPRVCNLSNVGRRWTGDISISGNHGSVSVESTRDSYFRLEDAGMSSADDLYFGYKVYIEFYDQYFQLKTTSDWIEWAYRDKLNGDNLIHQLRQVHVTLSDSARYVKIRYNCFQSSDVTDSGPHVDYTSDYINIRSSITLDPPIYFIFSEQIS